MALRLAGPDGTGHAHVPLVLVHRATLAAPRADVRAVLPAGARVEPAAGHWRRIRRPLAAEPRVEVVVPTRDHAALLERCARTVLGATAWERLGLCVVDNGSTDPAVAALLAALARDARVRVVRDSRPFNFPALVNAAVATSEADVVVLLNDDTEVLDAGWVETLAEEAVRPEVGAVAPLLLYPDGRVQQAGAAIGLWGTAGHPFAGLDPWRPTPFGAAEDATRNWLAVSAACLAVERRKLLAAGGLDEAFAVAGNDVDLGLRLTAAGHRSLCVPHARLLHHEGASRGQSFAPGDLERSRERYAPWLAAGDPFYHPALTLRATSCALRGPDEAGP
jgi:GT2 family glycosyltransferase